jgi:hypothetical protein
MERNSVFWKKEEEKVNTLRDIIYNTTKSSKSVDRFSKILKLLA